MQRSFTLEYWKTERWYVGRLKEAPEVLSQGKTLEELEENIRDAYQLMMMEVEEPDLEQGMQTKKLRIEV